MTISAKSTVFRIDLSAIRQKSLDQALFLCIFIQVVRSNSARASITIAHVRKFLKVHQNIVGIRFLFGRFGITTLIHPVCRIFELNNFKET